MLFSVAQPVSFRTECTSMDVMASIVVARLLHMIIFAHLECGVFGRGTWMNCTCGLSAALSLFNATAQDMRMSCVLRNSKMASQMAMRGTRCMEGCRTGTT